MGYPVQRPSLQTTRNTKYMILFITMLTLRHDLAISFLTLQVTVALVDLSPEFNYTSVPRLSPHSFLQAKAKNTSNYAMLAGPSNIFLDNNFIAKVNTHLESSL